MDAAVGREETVRKWQLAAAGICLVSQTWDQLTTCLSEVEFMFRTRNRHTIKFSLKQALSGALPGEVHWSSTDNKPEKSLSGDMRGCFYQGATEGRGGVEDKGMRLTWC